MNILLENDDDRIILHLGEEGMIIIAIDADDYVIILVHLDDHHHHHYDLNDYDYS